MAVVRMETILWKLGQWHHREFLRNNPGVNVSVGVIVTSTLQALEANGDAAKHIDARAT
jgi:hypothetical protein